jgi:hypothetical protein
MTTCNSCNFLVRFSASCKLLVTYRIRSYLYPTHCQPYGGVNWVAWLIEVGFKFLTGGSKASPGTGKIDSMFDILSLFFSSSIKFLDERLSALIIFSYSKDAALPPQVWRRFGHLLG